MTLASPRRGATLVLLALLVLLLSGLPFQLTPAAAGPVPQPPVGAPDPAAEAPSTPESAPEPGTELVVVDEITPWLDPDGALRVSGTVINRSDTDLRTPALELRMSTDRLDSRLQINRWSERGGRHRILAASTDTPPGDPDDAPQVPDLPDSLAPGQVAEFAFEVPADRLELPTSSPISAWGARGVEVALSGRTDSGAVAGSATGFTTWYPDPDPDPTSITLVMPVTLPGFSSTGLLPQETLEQAAGPEGPLTALLAAAEVDPAIALAIDPRLLASIDSALRASEPAEPEPSAPLPTGTAAPSEPSELVTEPADGTDPTPLLRDWFTRFADLAEGRTLIALPWADADLASLTEGDLDGLAERAQEDAAIVTEMFPQARTDVVWPVSGTVTQEHLPDLVTPDTNTVVVSDLQQPALTGYTSDAHSTVTVAAGPEDGTGADDSGSRAAADDPGDGSGAMEGGARDTSAGSPRILDSLVVDTGLYDAVATAGAAGAPAAAVSEYVAESSAITAERPYDSRHLFVTLPRTAADSSWRDIAEATRSAPWLAFRSVDALLEGQPVSRAPVVASTRRTGLTAEAIAGLRSAHSAVGDYAAVFSDADSARRDLDRMMLGCAQAAWADAPNRAECTEALETEVAALTSSIRPEEGSPVLLVTGERTTIPIRVENSSGRPATVTVRVTAPTPQLRTAVSETVELSPHESTRVDVPVEGLANADLITRVEIVADNGYVVPHTGELMVRVRADWENIGTAVIAAGLLIVFVVGLAKSVSRGRRKIPKSQLEAAMARAQQNDRG